MNAHGTSYSKQPLARPPRSKYPWSKTAALEHKRAHPVSAGAPQTPGSRRRTGGAPARRRRHPRRPPGRPWRPPARPRPPAAPAAGARGGAGPGLPPPKAVAVGRGSAVTAAQGSARSGAAPASGPPRDLGATRGAAGRSPGYSSTGQIGLRPCASTAQSTVFSSRLLTPLNACARGQPLSAQRRARDEHGAAAGGGRARALRNRNSGELAQLSSTASRCASDSSGKAAQNGNAAVTAATPPSASAPARHASSSNSLAGGAARARIRPRGSTQARSRAGRRCMAPAMPERDRVHGSSAEAGRPPAQLPLDFWREPGNRLLDLRPGVAGNDTHDWRMQAFGSGHCQVAIFSRAAARLLHNEGHVARGQRECHRRILVASILRLSSVGGERGVQRVQQRSQHDAVPVHLNSDTRASCHQALLCRGGGAKEGLRIFASYRA